MKNLIFIILCSISVVLLTGCTNKSSTPQKITAKPTSIPTPAHYPPTVAIVRRQNTSQWSTYTTRPMILEKNVGAHIPPGEYRLQFRIPNGWKVEESITDNDYFDCGLFKLTSPENDLLTIQVNCNQLTSEDILGSELTLVKIEYPTGDDGHISYIVRKKNSSTNTDGYTYGEIAVWTEDLFQKKQAFDSSFDNTFSLGSNNISFITAKLTESIHSDPAFTESLLDVSDNIILSLEGLH